MEIICPDVVLPGTYFNCTADIPKGQGLSAVFTLTDDLTKVNFTSSVKIPGEWNFDEVFYDISLKYDRQIIYYIQNLNWPCIIDRWTNIPGGPLVYGSYNDSAQFTSDDEQTKGFVLMSSYFENKANITAIEFVPMTAGQLVIEVYKKL